MVSVASFSMTSRIILQACEQPSGDEWMVMGFSAAPAFSLRWMSTLTQTNRNAFKEHSSVRSLTLRFIHPNDFIPIYTQRLSRCLKRTQNVSVTSVLVVYFQVSQHVRSPPSPLRKILNTTVLKITNSWIVFWPTCLSSYRKNKGSTQ